MSQGFSFPVCFQLDYDSNGSAKHPFLVNHTISINSCPTKAAEVPYTLKLHQILKLATKPEIAKLSNSPFCLILPEISYFSSTGLGLEVGVHMLLIWDGGSCKAGKDINKLPPQNPGWTRYQCFQHHTKAKELPNLPTPYPGSSKEGEAHLLLQEFTNIYKNNNKKDTLPTPSHCGNVGYRLGNPPQQDWQHFSPSPRAEAGSVFIIILESGHLNPEPAGRITGGPERKSSLR